MDAYIVDYARSPFHFARKGRLATLRPDGLAAQVVRALAGTHAASVWTAFCEDLHALAARTLRTRGELRAAETKPVLDSMDAVWAVLAPTLHTLGGGVPAAAPVVARIQEHFAGLRRCYADGALHAWLCTADARTVAALHDSLQHILAA